MEKWRKNEKIVVSNTIIPLEDIRFRAIENYKYLFLNKGEQRDFFVMELNILMQYQQRCILGIMVIF